MYKYDVVVIGLGAVGSATLYQLASKGVNVLGIDRFHPPHSYGSSHGETRITRLAVGEGKEYIKWAKRSQDIWKELGEISGKKLFYPCGAIIMDSGVNPWGKYGSEGFFERTINYAKEFDIAHQLLSAKDIQGRFPQFQIEDTGRGYYEQGGGYVNPELCIQVQLELAQKRGAMVWTDTEVLSLTRLTSGAVKLVCAGKSVIAERVLLSAGGWIKDFLSEKESLNYRICRQVLHWLKIDSLHKNWNNTPVFMWGLGSSPEDFTYGFPSIDGRSVKMATEEFVETTHPDHIQREVTKEEQQIFWEGRVEGKINGISRDFIKSTVCFYTVTADAKFVVKPLADMEEVLLVSACSGHGFKHSAALGEHLAGLLIQEV